MHIHYPCRNKQIKMHILEVGTLRGCQNGIIFLVKKFICTFVASRNYWVVMNLKIVKGKLLLKLLEFTFN